MKEFEQSIEAQTAEFVVNSLREKMPEQMTDINSAINGAEDSSNFIKELAVTLGISEAQIKGLNPTDFGNEIVSRLGHAVAQIKIKVDLDKLFPYDA